VLGYNILLSYSDGNYLLLLFARKYFQSCVYLIRDGILGYLAVALLRGFSLINCKNALFSDAVSSSDTVDGMTRKGGGGNEENRVGLL
jgi:hypothetical protein